MQIPQPGQAAQLDAPLGEPAAGVVPVGVDETLVAAAAPLAGCATSNVSPTPTALGGQVSTALSLTHRHDLKMLY